MKIKQISVLRFVKSKEFKEMLNELSIEIKLFNYKFRTDQCCEIKNEEQHNSFGIPKNVIENK